MEMSKKKYVARPGFYIPEATKYELPKRRMHREEKQFWTAAVLGLLVFLLLPSDQEGLLQAFVATAAGLTVFIVTGLLMAKLFPWKKGLELPKTDSHPRILFSLGVVMEGVVKTEKWSVEQIQAATEKVTERIKRKPGDLLATAVEIQCELTEILDQQEDIAKKMETSAGSSTPVMVSKPVHELQGGRT